MSARKTRVDATKAALRKHAKRISKQVSAAAKQVKDATAPPKRKRATDKTQSLKQYANLNKKGSTQRVAKRDEKRRQKAAYLASLPKHPLKRLAYRLNPKRTAKYLFSREGAIMALKVTGIAFAVGTVFLIAIFAYFRRDLPDPRDLAFEEATRFYDRTGEHLLYTVYGEENRTIVEFDRISEHAKNATIALEDRNFYEHSGFSVTGIMRAAVNNVLNRDATGQGGSTLTQQFIKNSLVGDEQSYIRKIKELILAVELERLYSKDEILSFYLNEIPYGSLEYGIESAAHGFFDKSASELTIDEAAMLAALPQAPSYYSPYGGDTEALVARQHFTIDQMQSQGYITQEEADEAKAIDTLEKIIPIEERSQYRNITAPHFVLEIQEQLQQEYGETTLKKGGLKVITSLDWDVQKKAEKAMRQNFKFVRNPANGVGSGGDNAAISITDVETGQVVAQVGSRDFSYKGFGAFNAATAGRQPGSSFKPFGYSQMFYNERWSPGSIIWDTNTTFGDYKPENFDFRYPGPMTIRDALGRSRNIPAVKALYIAGVDETVDLARAMGNKSLIPDQFYGLSLVLGAGEVHLAEHTHAYSTFARGGVYKDQSYILKVENPDGTTLYEWEEEEGEEVLDPQVAYLMTNILTDDRARAGTFGLGNPNLVVPGLNHAVKTGTTDQSKDGWMMGFTTCYAVGVWAGNHDSKPMDTITSWQTGPIFTQVMKEIHTGKKNNEACGTQNIARPDGVKNVRIDRQTGRNATDKTPSGRIINDIAASWFKGVGQAAGQEVVIDTVSNKLATNCTPERARKTITDSGVAPELPPEDPFFSAWARSAGYSAGGSTSIKEKDDVHDCDDEKPVISIDNIDYDIITVAYTEGTHDLDEIQLIIDGQTVSRRSVNSSGSYEFSIKADDYSGNQQVQAVVIDEALYDSTDSQNYNFQKPEDEDDDEGGGGGAGGGDPRFPWIPPGQQ